jgi:glucose-6-phosphate dehydrogenase assembly protein OpcA
MILRMFTRVADRVLIDSSEELHPAPSLVSWGAFLEEHHTLTAFGDLAWTHLTQWRSVLAQAFQPDEVRQQSGRIDAVTIEYSSTSFPLHSGLSQAFLAVGWLAEALHWVVVHPFKEQHEGEHHALFRLEEQAITVRIHPGVSMKGRPGGIESIVLHFADGRQISHRTGKEPGCIRMRSSFAASDADDAVVSLHQKTEEELVSNELEVLYHDPGYEASMSLLTGLLSDWN